MANAESKTLNSEALSGLAEDQKRQIDDILIQYAQKAITATEMEWQIRRIIQWSIYCNVGGGLRFGQDFLQQ